MKTYWEWWSSANNLCGTFDTYEQLIEGAADYMQLWGWRAGEEILASNYGEFGPRGGWTKNRQVTALEVFRDALTYG